MYTLDILYIVFNFWKLRCQFIYLFIYISHKLLKRFSK